MKILLVEDHAVLADVSSRLLRDVHGHAVVHAATGAQALKRVERWQPDLMLIDLNLPDMDGFQLAERLRADPRFATTVLVALTGWGNLMGDKRAQAAGFDVLFRKPMDFAILPQLRRAPGRA